MTPKTPLSSLVALLALFVAPGLSDTGVTTRYWDCCKPSCAWPGKSQVSEPVLTCNKQDQWDFNSNLASGCGGGEAYTCGNNGPWAINDNLAYGFAAANLNGKSESDWCCACYQYVCSRLPYLTSSLPHTQGARGQSLGIYICKASANRKGGRKDLHSPRPL